MALSLQPRGDIHGGAEVVKPVIEGHRDARPLVQSKLYRDCLGAMRRVESSHPLLDRESCGYRFGRIGEGGHHRIPDGFHDGSVRLTDRLREKGKMLAHQLVSPGISDTLV